MVRRVSNKGGLDNLPNIFANLALLGNLGDQNEKGEEAPLDLYGTSQEPENFNESVATPQYTDVRQNENDYIENLRKIGNLPLAMSEDNNLRQDASENMRQIDPTLPFAVEEEQLEGLSGKMGQDQTMPQTHVIPQNSQSQLSDPLEVIRQMTMKDPSLLELLPEETRQQLNQTTADIEKPFVPPQPPIPETTPPETPAMVPETPIIPADTPITEEMVEKYPDQTMKAGAVEEGFADERIVNDLLDLAGGIVPDEQIERAKQWNDVYTKRREELTAEQNQLLQQAESGNLSTFDKVALGIAVAIPILMALRYGAQAGLTSGGKALEGFGKTQLEQDKQQNEKEIQKSKRFGEVNKELVGLEEKDIDINKKILDSIPDKAARQFMKNKRIRGFGNNIGISTGDESDLLWLDAKKFDSSDEGIKRAREVVKDADATIGITKDANKTLNEVLEILNQLPKNTGAWEALTKQTQLATSAGGKYPSGGAVKIKMKDENGKTHEVDALAILKQKINILQDLYNKQILGGTRLTGNVVTHWGGILGDPSSISDWFSQDLNTFKDTTKSLKDTMNSRTVEELTGMGFLRNPLEKAFPSYQESHVESEDNRLDRLRQSNKDQLRKKVK